MKVTSDGSCARGADVGPPRPEVRGPCESGEDSGSRLSGKQGVSGILGKRHRLEMKRDKWRTFGKDKTLRHVMTTGRQYHRSQRGKAFERWELSQLVDALEKPGKIRILKR